MTEENTFENEIQLKDQRITELESELTRLKNELLEKERSDSERKAFNELFPSESFDAIPDEVHEKAKEYNSLLAAYALYHRRKEIERQRAESIKKENLMRTAGNITHDGGNDGTYSLEEIARMSPQEIKRNYNQIIKSLIKKNK